jgi:putative spermidine/putrescine transport system permease protein
VIHSWNLDNFREIANAPYPTIILRTVLMASAVTITCMLLAFPYAYFLVRVAGRRLRIALLVATVLPLWVSYLVRVYSWRLLLNPDGAVNWVLRGIGLPGQNLLYTNWAMWLVYSYIWFPFMVLPVYAALERIPGSLLEASSDLGARGFATLRRVVLPLAARSSPSR